MPRRWTEVGMLCNRAPGQGERPPLCCAGALAMPVGKALDAGRES